VLVKAPSLARVGNAVRLHYAAMRERGGLANLFKLMISPAERRKQFQRQQETEAGPPATTGAEP
jgi:hypothetical protein